MDYSTGEAKYNCQLADSTFSFFFKEGEDDRDNADEPGHGSDDSDNLLIYIDQGGACWDQFICIAAAETGMPVSAQAIDRASVRYAQTTGILADRADNPFRNWHKVFVPACAGDVLWGSNDALYPNQGIDGLPLPGIIPDPAHPNDIAIHHRGFDNFLASLKWVTKHLGDKPRKVMVAGSSAGGYGAATGFAFVKEVWPDAETYLLSDAANGVIGPAFTQAVLNNPASPWGQQANLPTWIPGMADLPNTSNQFFPTFFSTLANHYAKKSASNHHYGPTKTAQYTTEWDVDQAFYFGAMQEQPIFLDLSRVFSGNGLDNTTAYYPYQNRVYCGWHGLMDNYTNDLVNGTVNYHYYRAAGYTHTILTETPPVVMPDGTQVSFNPKGIFYSENSAGVSFNQWIRGMLGEAGRGWENQPPNIVGGNAFPPPPNVICDP